MLPQLNRIKGIALDLLFPPFCVGCGGGGSFLCPSCRSQLPRILPPYCPKCGQHQASGILCPGCVGWRAHIDGIRSPFIFNGVIRRAVHQLKYRNLRALATPLAELLAGHYTAHPVPGEVLVPVPLHPKRRRERGYNQSRLLAREMARITGLSLVDDCLIRERPAAPQARTQNIAERQRNVAGAFTCRHPGLKGRRVIIVDDVVTSGATVDACAKALKRSGVTSVWALALAKEV